VRRQPGRSSYKTTDLGNGRAGNQSAHIHWLNYDRREFGEMLSDWQQAVSPGDAGAFIRDHLHLDGSLSTEQFIQLVSGTSAPSKELAHYLAAAVPESIASPLVMRRRATPLLDAGTDTPIIAPSAAAIHCARLATLKGFMAAPTGKPRFDAWKHNLLERLAEQAAGEPIDPNGTLQNLAKYLQTDANVLAGRKTVPLESARQIGNDLAALLGLEGEDFDAFADDAAHALSLAGDASATLPLGQAVRFIRHLCADSQQDFAARLHCNPTEIGILEQGFPVARPLKHLLALPGISASECNVIDELARASVPARSTADAVVQHFAKDGLTTRDYLRAATKHPLLVRQRPSTLIANIEGVVNHFAKDGITTHDYLRAIIKQPYLFSLRPATIIANVNAVVNYFAKEGVNTDAYLQAALKRSQILCLRPSTLIGNIEGVVNHFAQDGLTIRDYLHAAIRNPQLFYQRPSTLIANIEGVVNHFAQDGLIIPDYLHAAIRNPQLFCQRPSTLTANIEGVVNHFAEDGLTARDYLRAAIMNPALFCRRPSTLAGNIEGVVNHFAQDGLTARDYLRAAIKRPSFFCQRPSSIVSHINHLASLQDAGLLPIPSGRPALLAYLVKDPSPLIQSDSLIHLRELASHVTGRRLGTQGRHLVEQALHDHLGQPADGTPPDKTSHARRLLLNALKREGYLRAR